MKKLLLLVTGLFFTASVAAAAPTQIDWTGAFLQALTPAQRAADFRMHTFTATSTTASSTLPNLSSNKVQSGTSAGLTFFSNSGSQVADFGAGGGSNATFFGGVNIDGQTRIASNLTGIIRADNGVLSTTTTPIYLASTSPWTVGNLARVAGNGTLESIATSSLGLRFTGLTDTPGTLNANRVIFTNSLGTALTDNASFVSDGTRLGIGTAVLSNGIINIGQNSGAAIGSSSIAIGSIAGTPLFGIRNDNNTNFAIDTITGGNWLQRFNINRNNGNVGISSSTPGARLVVAGAGTGTGVTFQTTDSSNVPRFSIFDNGTVVPSENLLTLGLMTSAETAGTLRLGRRDGVGRFHEITAFNSASQANNYLDFGLHNATLGATTSVMRLFGNGNVGIGTSTPETGLHLFGIGTATTLGQLNTNLRLQTNTGTVNAGSEISFRGTSAATNTATAIYAAISAPVTVNGVSGAAGYLSFSTKTALETALTERLRITSTGNVGIGTTTPSARLTISGDMRLTGRFADASSSTGSVGQLLMATAAGTQWVSTSTLGFLPDTIATGTLSTGPSLTVTAGRSVLGGAATVDVAPGFEIPTSTGLSNLFTFYDTPSTRITAGTNLSWAGNTLNATVPAQTVYLATSTGYTTGGLAFATGPGTIGTTPTTTLVAGTGISFSGGTPIIIGSSPITIESTGGGGGGGSLSTTTDIVGDGPASTVSYVTTDVMFGGSASTSAEFLFDKDGAKLIIASSSPVATSTFANTNTAQAVQFGVASTTGDALVRGIHWAFSSLTQVVTSFTSGITSWVIQVATTIFQGNVEVAGSVSVGTNIVLQSSTTPPVPPTDSISIFRREIAGRSMVAQMGPSGLDTTLQPLIARNKVGVWMPPGNGTVVPGVFGIAAPTVTGFTATARNVATTNLFTRMRRLGYVSAATAAAVGQFRNGSAQFTVGSSTNPVGGGFMFITRFGISDAAAVSGARMFMGVGQSATPSNVEPSTLTQVIGMCHGAADTNFRLCYGGTTAQTPIDLGANFPANTRSTDVYELALFSAPNSGNVDWEVTRLNTGDVATGTISNTSAAVLPSHTTLLAAPWAYRTNNATALAVGLDVMSFYIETDF